MRNDAIFIGIEVDDAVTGDAELAAKLEEVCPVSIFTAADGRVEIVDENVDECILCALCVQRGAAGHGQSAQALLATNCSTRPRKRSRMPPTKGGFTCAGLGQCWVVTDVGDRRHRRRLAHAAVGWTKISTDDKSSSDSPSLALAGGSVVAAFPRVNNGTDGRRDGRVRTHRRCGRPAELDQAHQRRHRVDRLHHAVADPVSKRARRPADHAVRHQGQHQQPAERDEFRAAQRRRDVGRPGPHGPRQRRDERERDHRDRGAGQPDTDLRLRLRRQPLAAGRRDRPYERDGGAHRRHAARGQRRGQRPAVRPRRRRALLAQLVQLAQSARGLPAAVRPDHRAADRQRRTRAEVDRSR